MESYCCNIINVFHEVSLSMGFEIINNSQCCSVISNWSISKYREILLTCSWLIPVNPFKFNLHKRLFLLILGRLFPSTWRSELMLPRLNIQKLITFINILLLKHSCLIFKLFFGFSLSFLLGRSSSCVFVQFFNFFFCSWKPTISVYVFRKTLITFIFFNFSKLLKFFSIILLLDRLSVISPIRFPYNYCFISTSCCNKIIVIRCKPCFCDMWRMSFVRFKLSFFFNTGILKYFDQRWVFTCRQYLLVMRSTNIIHICQIHSREDSLYWPS